MPDPVRYHWCEDIPPHLQTRTQLARQGLRPARGQSPVATMRNQLQPQDPYVLYDVGQAIPKRPATPAQREAVVWARETLADPGAVVLDTETTDLYGEIIEVAVLTMRGEVLIDTLVCPTGGRGPISLAATAVHGLTMAKVTEAPTFAQLAGQVAARLSPASRIVAWNSAFDYFTLQRTCALAQVEDLAQATDKRWTCAMEWYVQWWGEWSDYHGGGYRWQPLGGGHRAREDCLTVLERLRAMASEEAETS